MCMIRLHLHIGGVALIGPASDWLVEVVVPDVDSPEACPPLELPKESGNTEIDVYTTVFYTANTYAISCQYNQ